MLQWRMPQCVSQLARKEARQVRQKCMLQQLVSKSRPVVGQGSQPTRTGPLLLAEQYRLGMLGVAALHK